MRTPPSRSRDREKPPSTKPGAVQRFTRPRCSRMPRMLTDPCLPTLWEYQRCTRVTFVRMTLLTSRREIDHMRVNSTSCC